MLQRSSLPSTSTAELADTLGRSFGGPLADGVRWRAWQNLLPLPATWQQYVLACLALAVVLGGMLMHVLLSVQIARADFQLRQMQSEYARIERQNSELVYQITQRSSLAHMAQLAAEQGYVPATGRTYVVRSSNSFDDPVRSSLSPQAVAPAPAAIRPTATPATSAGGASGTWLEQTAQWWQEVQQASSTATSQLWRDVTGRME